MHALMFDERLSDSACGLLQLHDAGEDVDIPAQVPAATVAAEDSDDEWIPSTTNVC